VIGKQLKDILFHQLARVHFVNLHFGIKKVPHSLIIKAKSFGYLLAG
jgi:hypothetical protein